MISEIDKENSCDGDSTQIVINSDYKTHTKLSRNLLERLNGRKTEWPTVDHNIFVHIFLAFYDTTNAT